jgi:DNA end-binding protein Ku
MARAIWKGTLSFGLVEIPVGLHSAEKPDELKFTLLEKQKLTPVHYRRVTGNSAAEVPWEDVVRGYEHKKGQYVVLSDQDLKRANAQATQTVQVLHFVDQNEVEPIYFEKPYYLVPSGKQSRSYVLFRDVLEQSGKCAIASVVIRTRQHLCAVMVRGPLLVLDTLRYAHEIVDPATLDLPAEIRNGARITATERDIAERLVESMVAKFDPESYHDTYRDELLKFIRAKLRRGEAKVLDESDAGLESTRRPEVIDLMPLLKESLAALGRKGGGKKAPSKSKGGVKKAARHRGSKKSA